MFEESCWQFRSTEAESTHSVEGVRPIDREIDRNKFSVGIFLKVTHNRNNSENVKINIQLQPINNRQYLPDTFHVIILNEKETVLIEAKAKQ